jgi:dTDP-4-dehydrorhamnose reductase
MSKEISKTTKIFIAGHRGMVGKACLDLLIENGHKNLIYRTREELDLRDSDKVLNLIYRRKAPRL